MQGTYACDEVQLVIVVRLQMILMATRCKSGILIQTSTENYQSHSGFQTYRNTQSTVASYAYKAMSSTVKTKQKRKKRR
jgi:hypothetical protein